MNDHDPFSGDWPARQALPVATRRRCIWCAGDLGPAEGQGAAGAPAVCDRCAASLSSLGRESLASFVDRIPAPLLVLTAAGGVEMANASARVFLGKAAEGIVGHLAGEVIECVNAAQPGGCGRTAHCSGCTLRRSVQHTHETGQALHGIHTWHEVRTPAGIRTAWYEISTERAAGLVVMRISQLGIERRA